MNGLKIALLAGACALATVSIARADDYVDMATKAAKAATARADKWDGPTTGPTAAKGKKIVFVAADLKNGGILGASEGVKEAAKAIGWTVIVIDGQGSVSGRTAAMNQALTLKPDGIVAGGFDTNEQKVAFDAAAKSGAVGRRLARRHASGTRARGGHLRQRHHRAEGRLRHRRLSGDRGIGRQGRRRDLHRFAVRNRRLQGEGDGGCDQEMRRLQGARICRLADRRVLPAHAAAHHDAPAEVRRQVDALAGDQRSLLRLHGPLARRGRHRRATPRRRTFRPATAPSSAFQRIRAKQYQDGTVPEPLNMQGWQLVDELNRAFAKQPWSGYTSGIHLVTADNVAFDGGDKNVFDPGNGYRDEYKKIWGVK